MELRSALPEYAIHVWYTPAPTELAKDLSTRYLALLTPEEQKRHDRFMQAKDRCHYLLGKMLVRAALSRYYPLAVEAWTFTTNRFGKPVVSNDLPRPVAHFNLAHTEGLVACVLARDFEVGIDVENVGRTVNLDIARRFFAPAEVAHLEQAPEKERQRVFFLFWTLKEAYVKARGLGLSLPLEQFAFRLDNNQAPSIAFEPAMRDDPTEWQFFLPDVPSPAHQAAVAAHCGTAPELAIEIREMKF